MIIQLLSGSSPPPHYCNKCNKTLETNQQGFMRHMSVDHEMVMLYVDNDMSPNNLESKESWQFVVDK